MGQERAARLLLKTCMTGDKQKKLSQGTRLFCCETRPVLAGLKQSSLRQARVLAPGFTLIEMLVAMTVFVLAATTATDLYIAAGRSQRAIRTRERLQNEVRFAFETMSRAIRGGTIDYNAYVGGAAPSSGAILNLRNTEGDREIFRASSSSSECPENAFSCLLICDAVNCSPLTASGIIWDEIRFYISPARDPFLFDPSSGTFGASVQPHVTVFARVRIGSNLPEERAEITLQTSITSRIYKR